MSSSRQDAHLWVKVSGLTHRPTLRQMRRAVKVKIFKAEVATDPESGKPHAYLVVGSTKATQDLIDRTDIFMGKQALTFSAWTPEAGDAGVGGIELDDDADGVELGDDADGSLSSAGGDETPDETPDETLHETPDAAPDETPDATPDATPDETSYEPPSPAQIILATYATTASASVIDTPTRQRIATQARRHGVFLRDSTRARFSLPVSLPSASSSPAAVAVPRDGRRHTAPTPSRYVRDRTPPSSRRSSSASSGFDFACVGSPENTQGLFGSAAAAREATSTSSDRGEGSSNGLYHAESPTYAPSRVVDGLTSTIKTFSEKFDGLDRKVHDLELAGLVFRQNDEMRVELEGLRNAVETSQGDYEVLELAYRDLETKADDLAEQNATLIDTADELRVDKEDAERVLTQERAEHRERYERLKKQNILLGDRLQASETRVRSLEAKKKSSARSGFGADITNIFGTPAPVSGATWRPTPKRDRAADENEPVERDANRRKQMSRE